MFLKRLELQGFKSFPDKIALDFTQGLTAIVGPNGSGKSNISDAIRWVLGEQSVKHLRGSKMEDVIFAGTQARKPLGFAEVSLTLDNSDKQMDIAFSEVTVTRRVFRSGESEYFINKAACRLKDVHEMFMDTGLGRDGYSIVGQGKIDEILSSKSEDRRHIFEEAAGISKYKYRKQEAERKLISTQDNLTRLFDIISELEGQIGPLKQQSDKAKRFLDLRERLKVLEVNLSVSNIERLRESLEEIGRDATAAGGQLEEVKQLLDAMDAEIARLYEESNAADEGAATLREEISADEGRVSMHANEINIFQNTIGHNIQTQERLGEEIKEIKRTIEENMREITFKEEDIAELKEAAGAKQAEIDSASVAFGQVEQEVHQKEAAAKELREELAGATTSVSELRASLSNTAALRGTYTSRLEELAQEIQKHREAAASHKKREQALSDEAAACQDELDGCEKELSELCVKRQELVGRQKKMAAACQEHQSALRVKSDKARMLGELEREGYQKGVRAVMQEKSLASLDIHGPLSKLIAVEQAYALAIETALGNALQNIVTGTEEDAKAAIAFLKKNRLGRVTFLPVSSVRGRKFEYRLEGEPGYIGIGADLVQADGQYRNILSSLLGALVVVDGIDNAITLARKYSYRFRIVTLEGDVLNAGGSMSGGYAGKRSGILSRQNEIQQLTQEAEKLQKRIKEEQVRLSALETELSTLTAAENEARDRQEAQRGALIRLAAEHRHAGELAAAGEQEAVELERSAGQIRIRMSEMQQQSGAKEQELAALEENTAALEHRLQALLADGEEAASRREAAADGLNRMKMELLDTNKNIEIEQERLNTMRAQITYDTTQIDSKQKQITEFDDKNEDLNSDIAFKQQQMEEIREEIDQKKARLEALVGQKKSVQEQVLEKQSLMKDKREQLLLLQQEYGRIENKKEKAELEIDAIINRLWEEYSLTVTTAMEYKTDIGSAAKAQKEINQLKSEIASLGNINIDAIEEYKRVSERYEFLSTQREDLTQAKDSLEKIIREMQGLMKTIFSEQFKVINLYFMETFRELFGGGSATLRLSDPSDVLESGVEIDVQPPGKKLQNLMLLSGGEKALCAIAILFAIIKTRPAPFCIFDEIEAALDDVNVYRFADYLKKINDKTQFIVVTHRHGTMEAADRLYGVTMQQKGVSRLIELNIDELEQARQQ